MSLFDFSKYRVFTKVPFDKAAVIYYGLIILSAAIYTLAYPTIIIYDENGVVPLFEKSIKIIFIEFGFALMIIYLINLTKKLFPILFAIYFFVIPLAVLDSNVIKVLLAAYTLTAIIIRFKYSKDESTTRKGQAFAFIFIIFVIAVKLWYEIRESHNIFSIESAKIFFGNLF